MQTKNIVRNRHDLITQLYLLLLSIQRPILFCIFYPVYGVSQIKKGKFYICERINAQTWSIRFEQNAYEKPTTTTIFFYFHHVEGFEGSGAYLAVPWICDLIYALVHLTQYTSF